MVTIKGPVAYFDVDGTLVLWNKEDHPEAIEFNERGSIHRLVPHKGHIAEIKNLRQKEGYSIIVWSKRGGEWAKEVVTRLGLTEYVDAAQEKPYKVYDDIAVCEFMPMREYIKIGDEHYDFPDS